MRDRRATQKKPRWSDRAIITAWPELAALDLDFAVALGRCYTAAREPIPKDVDAIEAQALWRLELWHRYTGGAASHPTQPK